MIVINDKRYPSIPNAIAQFVEWTIEDLIGKPKSVGKPKSAGNQVWKSN